MLFEGLHGGMYNRLCGLRYTMWSMIGIVDRGRNEMDRRESGKFESRVIFLECSPEKDCKPEEIVEMKGLSSWMDEEKLA